MIRWFYRWPRLQSNARAEIRGKCSSLYEQADKDLATSKYSAYSKVWNTIHYTSLLRRTASAEAGRKETGVLLPATRRRLRGCDRN